MTDELQKHIDSLYLVFAPYGADANMSGSPNYGELDGWNAALYSKPLRDLTAEDLARYSGKAITTWGTVEDYKHFLPRILELIGLIQVPYAVWVSFDRLEMAGWTKWPQQEKRVIERYMLLLWKHVLNHRSAALDFEFVDYVAALARFYPNFPELLTIWLNTTNSSATLRLADYVRDHHSDLFGHYGIPGLYRQQGNSKEIRRWLLSPAILMKLHESLYRIEVPADQKKVAEAYDLLELYAATYNG